MVINVVVLWRVKVFGDRKYVGGAGVTEIGGEVGCLR